MIDMNSNFRPVFTEQVKWRVEPRAKVGHYRNRCLDLIHLSTISLLPA